MPCLVLFLTWLHVSDYRNVSLKDATLQINSLNIKNVVQNGVNAL